MTENSIDVNIVPVKNGMKRVVVSYYHYSRKEKDRMGSQTDYVWETKYGVIVHKIDKWYPSSKTCECGCINKGLSLRDRTWVCPVCGAVNDRDILAARNILRKGISELESMGNSGCRNAGVPYVCIQESHSL